MAEVAHVKVEAKGRGSCRCAVKKGSAALRHQRGRIVSLAGPDSRDREQIGNIQRVEKHAPDVSVSVSRKATAPGLNSVDGLQTTTEAEIANCFDNNSQSRLRL